MAKLAAIIAVLSVLTLGCSANDEMKTTHMHQTQTTNNTTSDLQGTSW
ncbi:MAG TPA: hypothetical protein VFG11_11415 [Acidobacteriota bacterium]|nr:hypothetical protein [Acidobacteriota bacterium]